MGDKAQITGLGCVSHSPLSLCQGSESPGGAEKFRPLWAVPQADPVGTGTSCILADSPATPSPRLTEQ